MIVIFAKSVDLAYGYLRRKDVAGKPMWDERDIEGVAGLHRLFGRGVLAEPKVGRSVAGARRKDGNCDRGGYGRDDMTAELIMACACLIGMVLLSPDDWWKL